MATSDINEKNINTAMCFGNFLQHIYIDKLITIKRTSSIIFIKINPNFISIASIHKLFLST